MPGTWSENDIFLTGGAGTFQTVNKLLTGSLQARASAILSTDKKSMSYLPGILRFQLTITNSTHRNT